MNDVDGFDVDGLINRLLDAQQKAADRVEAYGARMDQARQDLAHANDLIAEAYRARQEDRAALHAMEIQVTQILPIVGASDRLAQDVSQLSSRLEHLTGRIIGISGGMAIVVGAVGFAIKLGVG